MPDSVAGGTLGRARILLAQAADSVGDRDRFQANLEAAISFGRSATFHLQAEYAHAEDFPGWWLAQQTKLKSDPVARFFHDARTFIIHQGPVPVMEIISQTVQEVLGPISDYADAAVHRGRPWYRRLPRMWLEDLLRPLRRRIAKDRYRAQRDTLERLSRMEPVPGTTRSGYYFVGGPDGGDALALVARYLLIIEEVVREAENRYGAGSR